MPHKTIDSFELTTGFDMVESLKFPATSFSYLCTKFRYNPALLWLGSLYRDH